MRNALVHAFFTLAAFTLSLSLAHAGTEHNLKGWAWSSNIGWVSFNCTNESTCGTVNYGVTLESDGDLVGYAWSGTVGWIQFGGQSGFPTGGGTTAANARIVSNSAQGWARALANGGGWDGWISMAGTSPNYGVTQSGTAFNGYAWGGDVVGWLLFGVESVYPEICDPDCGVQLSGDADLDVKSSGISLANNTSVPYGSVPTFEWSLNNLPGGTTCSVSKTSSGGTSFSTVSGITSSGSVGGDALTDGSYTYQIECLNGGSTIVQKTVSFTVLAEPPGFTLGGTESARIQFISNGSSVSETRTIFVSPNNAFLAAGNPVSISITGFPTVPATTTYSFNGGASYSSNPGTTQIMAPYTTGVPFKVKVDLPITEQYQVTITGTATGAPTVTKTIIIDPTQFEPVFEEY